MKEAIQVEEKFFGTKGKSDAAKNNINSENILLILQVSQNVDNLILKIQNVLHRCTTLNYYIQRKLELKDCQNQIDIS